MSRKRQPGIPFWQHVYIDSRKVSKEKALREFKKALGSSGKNVVVLDVRAEKKGTWIRGAGYIVPYKVKVKNTGVLE